MPYEIVNKLRGTSVIRVVDSANVTINLSQLSANVNTENVYSAVISSLEWSTPSSGNVTITRTTVGSPANTIAVLHGTGAWQHNDHNLANSPAGNITATFLGGTGTLIMVLKKEANYNVETQAL